MKSILLLVLFCALLGAFGQLFFKLGSKELGLLPIHTNWKLALGLVLYGLATALFVFALRVSNLSIAYPVIATSYIWVMILSAIVLKEPITVTKLFGVLAILSGLGLIVR